MPLSGLELVKNCIRCLERVTMGVTYSDLRTIYIPFAKKDIKNIQNPCLNAQLHMIFESVCHICLFSKSSTSRSSRAPLLVFV